jgi:zinc transporter
VLLSFELGSGRKISVAELDAELRADSPNWVHLDRNHPLTRAWLETTIAFLDPVVIDALLEEETRPRIVVIGDGAIVILRAINHNPGAEPEDMLSFRLWIDAKRVISLEGRHIRAMDELARTLQGKTCPRNVGEFLTAMLEHLLDPMQPVLSEIEDDIDSAEEKMMTGPSHALSRKLTEIRRAAILLRRYIAPQREAFGQLLAADLTWLSDHDRRHLQESQHNVIRYVEDLDLIRERAQVVKDELQSLFASKLGRNTFLFSVMTAIFLPLTFVTGLLGINVGGIPGAGNEGAFWTIAGILAGVMVLEIAIFRLLKWF